VSGFRIERDDASAAFFDAAARGVLLLRRCPGCGAVYAPNRQRCRDRDDLEWAEASGEGVLVTWAVDHQDPLDPSLAGPDGHTSVFGFVELAEGPWLQVPIVDTDPVELRAGLPMVVRFLRPGGGEAIPVAAPARPG
jgi:uncharacterized OB-fold protein